MIEAGMLSDHSPLLQGLLAIACVAAIDLAKAVPFVKWVNSKAGAEGTDKANRILSVALAVLCTAAIHYKSLIPFDHTDLQHLGTDAGIQWAAQYGVYQVGWKPALKTLLGALFPAPPPTAPGSVAKLEDIERLKP